MLSLLHILMRIDYALLTLDNKSLTDHFCSIVFNIYISYICTYKTTYLTSKIIKKTEGRHMQQQQKANINFCGVLVKETRPNLELNPTIASVR